MDGPPRPGGRAYCGGVRVLLLGPLLVLDESGTAVPVPGVRQRSALALLALRPGTVCPADRMIDELWPGEPPRRPANALQLVVSKLRRALGGDAITTEGLGYRLALEPDDVDGTEFERLVGWGRAALGDGRVEQAVEAFETGLSMWRDDVALQELADLPSVSAAAFHWDELRAAATEERFEGLLLLGHSGDLVPELKSAIRSWPFRERLRARLAIALYRSGRQAEALAALAEAHRILAEELGLVPGAELRQLESAILNHDPVLLAAPQRSGGPSAPTAPVYDAGDGSAGNIPPSLTSFVGRTDDLQAVADLLGRHRLVTIVGPGGSGKTRLAAEFARRHPGSFPDGTWFAGLDSILAGSEVDSVVASALGFEATDLTGPLAANPGGLRSRLAAAVAGRRCLIVLDNCEHVIDDAAALAATLLREAPGARLLATSREPLRIGGEGVWTVTLLSRDDAVTLFGDRARAVAAEFGEVDDDELVARLCDGLDRLPLAIELTAARANAFTVEQMHDRLRTWAAIDGGERTAAPRHRSLRAATDWSHGLLFETERAVFRRLSVFAGGCSLDAAEAVCAGDQVTIDEVAGTIARLVDKSLVVAASGRYRLLVTLADYAGERLDEAAERSSTAQRHARCFADLAERSLIDWRRPGGRDQAWWLRRLHIDAENIRRALTWSCANGDGPTAARLGIGLGWFWWHAGQAVEGLEWLERILLIDGLPPISRGGLTTWLACLAMATAQPDLAAAHASAAEVLLADDGDPALRSVASAMRLQAALTGGDLAGALESLHRSIEANERIGEPWFQGVAAAMRAGEATVVGNLARAEQELGAAIAHLRTVGDVCTLVLAVDQLVSLLLARRAADDAEAALTEAVELCRHHGLRGWQAVTLNKLAAVRLARGDHAAARELNEASYRLAGELGLRSIEAVARAGLTASGGDHPGDRSVG